MRWVCKVLVTEGLDPIIPQMFLDLAVLLEDLKQMVVLLLLEDLKQMVVLMLREDFKPMIHRPMWICRRSDLPWMMCLPAVRTIGTFDEQEEDRGPQEQTSNPFEVLRNHMALARLILMDQVLSPTHGPP